MASDRPTIGDILMSTLILNTAEKEVLHSLLMGLTTRQIRDLGVDEHTFSLMASKSMRVHRGGEWPLDRDLIVHYYGTRDHLYTKEELK